jgi:4-amino-4-deoxy-L-arabinose transferase-like glycosyltransferase
VSQQPDRVSHSLPLEPTVATLTKIFFVVFVLFAAVIIVFPLHQTVELWDESRYANNAIEMATHGHWLTPTYNGAVDHWNTKPPLLIWIIAALYKLGLPPMMALRLPSSLSALASVLVVFFFGRNALRRSFVGLVAALLMMSSAVYFGNHVAMNGDNDALLCLFSTLYALGFFCFVEKIAPYETTGIVLAAVGLSGAIFTKGIAGVLLLPGLLVYILVRRRFGAVVKDRRFWIAIGTIVFVTVLYYKGRDLIDPGYLKTVWNNELGGRYSKTNEGHGQRTIYYCIYLIRHFEPGALLTLLGIYSLFPHPALRNETSCEDRTDYTRAAAIFCGVVALVFLAIISKSKTQIFYYCAPSIPFLSLFAALGLSDVLRRLTTNQSSNGRLPNATALLQSAVFILLVAITAIELPATIHQKDKVLRDQQYEYRYAIGDVAQARKQRGDSSPIVVIDYGFMDIAFPHYAPIANYYVKEAAQRGLPITFTQTLQKYKPGTWILTCNQDVAKALLSSQQLVSTATAQENCLYGQSAP